MARSLRSLRQVATLRHCQMARRFAPAFRALGVCEHSWLRYNNKFYSINCTKCRVSFLYEMSGFVFVRNVWFRFCTKCLVLVFVRDVVCTKCQVYELSCPHTTIHLNSVAKVVVLLKINIPRGERASKQISSADQCLTRSFHRSKAISKTSFWKVLLKFWPINTSFLISSRTFQIIFSKIL